MNIQIIHEPNKDENYILAIKERNIPTITLELSEEAPVETLKEPMFKIFKLLETM